MTKPVLKKKILPHLIALALGSAVAPQVFATADTEAVAAAEVAPSSDAAAQSEEQKVEVRGIRERLKRNLAEKRDAGNVVDTVTAEDVGKFPDKNVADSLQRVPGISVDRTWGEGRDIFVRGTDKNLNLTQLNGQAVASGYWWKNDSQSRGFNYDILASELVGSIDVYKSPSADLDEGSIGGLVVVKTRKPFQLKPLVAQVSAEATYSKLPKKTDPQLSGLLSWTNDQKTFGALVALSSQQRTMRRDGLENFTDTTKYNIIDQNGVVTPGAYASWGGGSAIFRQDRKRTTGDITLQARPNASTDLTLNYMNSDMSMDNSNQNYLWEAGGLADKKNNLMVTNPKFITTSDGTKALVGGTVGPVGGVSFEPIFRQSYVKSQVLDLDGTYDGDNWKLHGQAGTTKGSGGSDHDRNFWFVGNTRTTFNIAPDTYEVKYLDINPLDPSKLVLQNSRDWVRRMETKENYAQGDLTLELNGDFLKSLKFGAKFRDTTVQNRRIIGTDGPGNPGWQSFTLADLSTGASPLLSQKAANPGSLTQYAWVDDGLAYSKGFAMYDKGMVYAEAKNEYYRIKEKIYATYARADFATGQWRGDFGARIVKTDQTSAAYQDLNGNGSYTLGSVGRSYTDVLPNLNAVYSVNKDLLVRGAVARVMARNTYSDLSASTEVSGTTNAATAGNPLLKPYHANHAEIGAEWYYADASLLSATLFAKKLDTFIYTKSAQENVAGVTRTVTRPYNANNGETVNGLELQWQQAFSSGFGAIVNYTYTDAKTGANAGGQKLNVVGNSRNQANVTGFYEKDGYSLRLSYNYRSKAYGALDEGGQDVTSAYGQWDASASWDITPKVSLYLTAVNIGNAVIRTNTTDGLPVGVYENGARYSLGIKAKF
ncbi:TonB-dependent receptor [Duganella qianjiadongensis]|uniref:TonB-dependent receptor n=1 Tax=Duganella qianjiadongensis TaxID=2692176 RepID=A0ABW9VP14_9BURK|nr:TonB-dependent receptor [Duganella qianjiadongensis]MYM40891.1 TonB-dependent receptor [Duganella qianjiadongensis]